MWGTGRTVEADGGRRLGNTKTGCGRADTEAHQRGLRRQSEADLGRSEPEAVGPLVTLWYLSDLATLHNLSLDDIAQANILKLLKRYPDGFSTEASRNRTE